MRRGRSETTFLSNDAGRAWFWVQIEALWVPEVQPHRALKLHNEQVAC